MTRVRREGLGPGAGTESWWGWHGAGHRTSVRHELKTTPNGRLQVPPHTPQGPRPAPQFSGQARGFLVQHCDRS